MVSLVCQRDFRRVRKLQFCYLCGRGFATGEVVNRDHVQPQCIFLPADREPLVLQTHKACNESFAVQDEQIGQLIALRYGKVPNDPRDLRLRFALSLEGTLGAVKNLDIDGAVWRWIAGFHAALYREPGVGIKGSLVTPFTKVRRVNGRPVVVPLRIQHPVIVQTIVSNRVRGNLDRVFCNRGKLRYECVWQQADNGGPWMCFFALDIYDWKDLGRSAVQPARGCAGLYITPAGAIPANATIAIRSSIIIPVRDPLDAFA
jgi:hypothetical protein